MTKKYGNIVVVGLMVMIITSFLTNVFTKEITPGYTWGYCISYLGQYIGEICCFIFIRQKVKYITYLRLFMSWIIDLAIISSLYLIFADPYVMDDSKLENCGYATIWLLIQSMITYYKYRKQRIK